jgi:hypothetical protein
MKITAIKLNRPAVVADPERTGNYAAGDVLRVPEDISETAALSLLSPAPHTGHSEAHAVVADRNVAEAEAIRRGVAVKKREGK